MQREYAEAYIASLVCCRPEGERKRSVRVVCVISVYVLGAPHGLCVFRVVCVRKKLCLHVSRVSARIFYYQHDYTDCTVPFLVILEIRGGKYALRMVTV